MVSNPSDMSSSVHLALCPRSSGVSDFWPVSPAGSFTAADLAGAATDTGGRGLGMDRIGGQAFAWQYGCV